MNSNPRSPSALRTEAVEFLEVDALEGSYPWEMHIAAVLARLNLSRPAVSTDVLHD